MEKMLITGATGFLGSRAVDFYTGKYKVYAPTHRELDITDPQAAAHVIGQYQPDIVIHCAAISDVGQCGREPEKSWAINVAGSINIAKASREANASCILCSSDQVYFGDCSPAQTEQISQQGNFREHPVPTSYPARTEQISQQGSFREHLVPASHPAQTEQISQQGSKQEKPEELQSSAQGGNSHGFHKSHSEEESLCPVNVYGQQKLEAEQGCLKANPDCVVLRLSWMYDANRRKPGQHGDLFCTLLPQIRGTGKIPFPIYDRRGITDITEVVQNLEKTFRLKGGVYNFGSPNGADTYSTFWEAFSNAGLDTGRLEENKEAFRTNPRNLTMSQEKINQCGIFFSPTIESLSKNLANALENGIF